MDPPLPRAKDFDVSTPVPSRLHTGRSDRSNSSLGARPAPGRDPTASGGHEASARERRGTKPGEAAAQQCNFSEVRVAYSNFIASGAFGAPRGQFATAPQRGGGGGGFPLHYDASLFSSGSSDEDDQEGFLSYEDSLTRSCPPVTNPHPSSGRHSRHQPPQRQQGRGSGSAERGAPMLQAERASLLQRVGELSEREAAASAALAQARQENEALAGQVHQAQRVAREALAARRAAREALADVSGEHARLSAAYATARRDVSRLEAAL